LQFDCGEGGLNLRFVYLYVKVSYLRSRTKYYRVAEIIPSGSTHIMDIEKLDCILQKGKILHHENVTDFIFSSWMKIVIKHFRSVEQLFLHVSFLN
jgi:hypothetical protein